MPIAMVTRRMDQGQPATWVKPLLLLGALLFALHFTFQAKKAQIDPLLLLFITLANYGLLRHLLLGPSWRWWWLGWFFAGIGVITKKGNTVGSNGASSLETTRMQWMPLTGELRGRLHIFDTDFASHKEYHQHGLC